jgi:hypothetical protein
MTSPWLVVEDGFDPALATRYETLFTVGNGYLGTRGALEEGHQGALPGTFLGGVFDHHDSAVIDLVKAPDWVSLAVVVNGVRLDVTSATVLEHRRTLDLRTGTLSRDTLFADAQQSWSTDGPSNYTGFSDARVDRLLTEAAASPDPAVANELLGQADRLLTGAAVVLPLYRRSTLLAIRQDVANVRDNPAVGPLYNVAEWGLRG